MSEEKQPVQIVTGAQNMQDGDLVPAALHDARLPGGIHITKRKLRGEASHGMLCSLKELGLTRNDFPYAVEDGIWILQEPCRPGDDINRVIGNDDTVVDFEITNNRPDCYSIIGLAREAAAAFDRPMRRHEPREYTAAPPGPCTAGWTSKRSRRSACATGTPPGWWTM